MSGVVAQGHERVVVCSISSRRNEIFNIFVIALVSRQYAALSSASQHAMPTEIGGKRRSKCRSNTRLLLPTMLSVGYSVELREKLYLDTVLALVRKCVLIFWKIQCLIVCWVATFKGELLIINYYPILLGKYSLPKKYLSKLPIH